MSTTSFTTISWRTLYDAAMAKEPRVRETTYEFSGRQFVREDPAYAWVEGQAHGKYKLSGFPLDGSGWDRL